MHVQQKSLLSQHTVTKPILLGYNKNGICPVLGKNTMVLPTQKCSLSHSSALYKHLNWTEIVTSHSEVTYPLLRLLLLGPMLRSLGQRDGEESERIFERPPLPWRVSRGATGVKTPDNQSGILKSRN